MILATSANLSTALASRLYTHHKIDQHSGLSNNKVTSITKDKYGFYWIGTRRGLNYAVNGRIENLNDNSSFAGKEIKFVYTDIDEQVWVATESDLLLYDYYSRNFTEIDGGNSYSSANAIGSVSRGVVICRNDAIELYSHTTQSLSVLDIKDHKSLKYDSMVVLDDDNIIVICSQGRDIYRLNLTSLELDLYEDINLPIRTTSYRDRIFVDSKGRLWISIYNHSLACYSLEGEGVKISEFSTSRGNISHDLVLSINEYDGELIVGTDGGGINSIDIDTFHSRSSTKIFDYQELPLSRSVYSIYIDPKDGLFMGTIRDGIVSVHNSAIKSFSTGSSQRPIERQQFNNITTLAFCEGFDNDVWLATDGSGVWRFSTLNQSTQQIGSTKELKVTDICCMDRERLLIAIYGKGVYLLNAKSGAMSKVLIVDEQCDKSIADKDIVVSFTEPQEGKVMIIADKIYQFIPSQVALKATEVINNIQFTSGNLFATHQKDRFQYIHNLYSVYRLDVKNGACMAIYNTAAGGITSARMVDSSLWVIRNNSLYRYDVERQQEKMMLPNMSGQISSIEIDRRNHIWVTTFDSVVALDVNNPEHYIIFDNSMGYSPDEYLSRAAMLLSNGDIYMGGNNGFITIDSHIAIEADKPKPIELLSITIDGEVQQAKLSDNKRQIEVPWDYNSIDIEIYVENRNINHNNQFRYTIESKDKYATFISDNRLSLQMPPQGNHAIYASYLNNNGEWVSHTCIITIIITPPWWNSLIFKLIVTIIILCTLAIITILYTHNRERKLQQSHLEREQELSSNKIRFLINMSHELRTPLTLIYAPLKRLLESNRVEGETKRTLINIFSQSRKMAELINMVLDARRMESGYGEIEICTHDFNSWVCQIVDEFRDECTENKIEISTTLDKSISTLNYDAPKCRTVLSNLLMNAIRYSLKDGSGKIKITTEQLNRNVRLSVVDNGVGLVDIDIDKLFTRFVRVNNHTTGSGIGLSYSKAIIEQHRGGVIGAYCNGAHGATFFFEIPVGLTCKKENFEPLPYLSNMLEIEEKSQDANIEMTNEDFPISQHTILIVDDQSDLLQFLQEAISHAFKRVYTATNGVEALQSIRANKPSIVVSDVMMPQMDGYELCYQVKNDLEISHTPIVLLTAKADSASKMQGYKSGADAYISKPFDVQHLLSLVGSQLRSREIARKYYSDNHAPIKAKEITYSNADEQFMLKLNEFINENLSGSIDVEIIAKHLCMSRAALYKKLKSIIDIGAMEYVTKIRMTTAAERLRSCNRPITEIAMECGYNDNQYFSKAFKQFFGISPSQYRKDNSVRMS